MNRGDWGLVLYILGFLFLFLGAYRPVQETFNIPEWISLLAIFIGGILFIAGALIFRIFGKRKSHGR